MDLEYKFGLSTAIDAKKQQTKWVTRRKAQATVNDLGEWTPKGEAKV